MQSINN